MSTPRSRKARGKRLQNKVAKAIRDKFKLPESDVKSTTMGEGGMDVQLSARARRKFPYAVECKNVEKLALWDSWKQAKENKESLKPMLVVKRNRSDTLVVVKLEDFMELL